MKMQAATFEQLLDDNSDGQKLDLEITKARIATKDLGLAVRNSKLVNKERLGEAIDGFVKDAHTTGRGLSRFSAKVGSAVDDIRSLNEHVLQTISSSKPSSFSLWRCSKPPDSLKSTFVQSMNNQGQILEKLILAARLSLHNLDSLEARLSTLHSLVSSENISLSSDNDDVLAQLWTKLGGNRRQLKSFEERRALLLDVGSYRQRALAHVVAALNALQGLNEQVEELRERVAEPSFTEEEMPLEVQVRSIQRGIQRLEESQVKAKKRETEAIRTILGADADEIVGIITDDS